MAKTLNEIFARLDDDKANRALETNRERQKKQEEAERERRERQAAESAVEKYHVSMTLHLNIRPTLVERVVR
jgi:hypothetical protein